MAYKYLPPYYYDYSTGGFYSLINAFLFVSIVSALLFGLAAPIVMGIEGLKFGSLASLKLIPYYDLAFIVPELLAVLAATTLAYGVLQDYKGDGNLGDYWRESVVYFIAGLLLLGILLVLRPFF